VTFSFTTPHASPAQHPIRISRSIKQQKTKRTRENVAHNRLGLGQVLHARGDERACVPW
jgi:hypothetical protein